ncbi:MAG TPA: LPS export ABC transporter permease LptG [Burkholderiaceae bacterium]|nr:LPS export ABC transporter permease LptG [Burkholderiaceae bacterium]
MRIVTRYLSRELLVAVVFVLFALVALFAFFDLLGQLDEVGTRMRLSQAFLVTLLSLPSRIYEIMPIATLVGGVYVLSRMAASSEFTILRVSGMSAWRLARTLAGVGALLVVATYLFGELVAPPADRLAKRVKLVATKSDFVVKGFFSGVWVRDVVRSPEGGVSALRFINVTRVKPGTEAEGWRVFEFDGDYRLRTILQAARGEYVADQGWRLFDVVQTRIPPTADPDGKQTSERTQVVRDPELMWGSGLSPDIFGVLMVEPQNMALVDLHQYLRHLEDNRQQTDRYQIAYWGKVFYPLAILVMLALALPFAYMNVRSGGISLRIFAGVMIGIGFYGLNKLFAHLGLLNTWPPITVAVLPSLVMLGVAAGLLWWVERR